MVVKNRIDLARYFNELGFIVGAEVGVYEGHYSKILIDNIPNVQLYCIDNWKNVTNRVEREVQAREILKYSNAIIIKKHSMDAALDIPDESLDFVYIDANHQYHSVWDDITAWSKKVRKGGIVSGDDYYMIPGSKWGVIPAVNHYVKENGYKLQTSEWDGSLPEEDAHNQWWFTK